MPHSLAASLFRRLINRRATVPPRPPEVPDGTLVYAIGDVHGEIHALDALLEKIAAERQAADLPAIVVFLGDYVDRGRDSRAVLDRLVAGPPAGFSWVPLRGNHEAAMLDFIRDPCQGIPWLSFGGMETLASYGVRTSLGGTSPERCRKLRDDLLEQLPAAQLEFLRALPLFKVIGDFAFVHAGIRPGRALAAQKAEDILTIRQPFLDWPGRHDKVIVHGHTIVDHPELRSNRIAIDTGAYATGILTALAIRGSDIRLLHVNGFLPLHDQP